MLKLRLLSKNEYCSIQKRAISMRLARYLGQKSFNSSFDFDFTMSIISISPEAREIYLNKSQHEKLISRGQEKTKSQKSESRNFPVCFVLEYIQPTKHLHILTKRIIHF